MVVNLLVDPVLAVLAVVVGGGGGGGVLGCSVVTVFIFACFSITAPAVCEDDPTIVVSYLLS